MQRDALALRYHGCFWILARRCLAVLLLVELGRERVAMMPALPGIRRVANDREQPRPPLTASGTSEAPEMPERAQGRVLHDVLCVVIAPREIARQGVRGVQMRQHDGFESLELARLQPVLGVCGTPSSEDSASGGVIPAGISAGRIGSPPSRETVVTHAQEEDRHENHACCSVPPRRPGLACPGGTCNDRPAPSPRHPPRGGPPAPPVG